MLNKSLQKVKYLLIVFSLILLSTFSAVIYADCPTQTFLVKQEIQTKSAYQSPSVTFVYSLEALSQDAPLPDGNNDRQYTFNIKNNTSLNICLNTTKAGNYDYTIKMTGIETGSQSDYQLDKSIYTVTVQVLEVENEFYTRILQIKGSDGKKHQELIFKPNYSGRIPEDKEEPSDEEEIIPKQVKKMLKKGLAKTGELLESKTSLYILASILIMLLLILAYRRHKEKQDELKEQALLEATISLPTELISEATTAKQNKSKLSNYKHKRRISKLESLTFRHNKKLR